MTKRSLKYTFPGAFGSEVCALQDVAGGGSLVLNGTLANLIRKDVSFIERGYCRTVSLTSVNDLSGQLFTVTGTQNGVFFQEDIAGPNANTVYGTVVFDVITDVSVDGGVFAVSVGGGFTGFYTLIGIDPYMSPVNYSLRASGGDIAYADDVTLTLYGSNENLMLNGHTYTENIANALLYQIVSTVNNFLFPDTTASGLYGAFDPLAINVLLKIDGLETNVTRSTTLTFLQSGI